MASVARSALTDWYRPEVKPVREGWYQTTYDPKVPNWYGWSHWDGAEWGTIFSDSPERRPYHDGGHELFWRGMSVPQVLGVAEIKDIIRFTWMAIRTDSAIKFSPEWQKLAVVLWECIAPSNSLFDQVVAEERGQ